LTHNKLEILANIITSLIENIFDIESILKGMFEHQTESFRYCFLFAFLFVWKDFLFFRIYLLTDIYSLLAELVEWSDKLLFTKTNDDDRYRKVAKDLMKAVKVK
jgi:hypothetical protein